MFWIRRFIEEPEIRRNREAPAGFMHIFSALKPPYLSTTWRVAMMVTGAQGGGYALGVWLPTYLKTVRGISAVGTGGYTLVLILGAFFGFVTGAYLADGIGRKRTFMISAVASIVLTLVYLFAPISNDWFLPVGFVLGYVVADHVLADGLVHDRAVSRPRCAASARASATTPAAASVRCSRRWWASSPRGSAWTVRSRCSAWPPTAS